jgi:predicted ATP-grasp superfamily ATP-dependent carboligase
MKVFVYEYSCALVSELPIIAAVRKEGWAMLSAFLDDFAALPGTEAVTLLAEDIACTLPGVTCRRVDSQDEKTAFVECCREADFTLAIAPEFDELLLRRCQWIAEAGGRSLGCSVEIVTLAGDKLELARQLRAKGVRTPPCVSWPDCSQGPPFPFPVVLKPRFGAGSQATFLARNRKQLDSAYAQARREGWCGPMLVQPFVPGKSVSVTFLVGPRHRLVLLPASQELSEDGRFYYQGGTLPLIGELSQRAIRLGRQAIDSLVGIHGYVGVDLVLGRSTNGSGDCVIEINPRPTTSYVGLRALTGSNLAAALLNIVQGTAAPVLAWRSSTVRFYADGSIEELERDGGSTDP